MPGGDLASIGVINRILMEGGGGVFGANEASPGITNSLVAYYRLEEASGTRVDATGRGNDLTDNNTVTQNAGRIGNAAQFVAVNSESLSRVDSDDHDMGDINFTVCCWAWLDSKPANNMGFISKFTTTGSQRSWRIFWDTATDRILANISNTGAVVASLSAASFGVPPTGQWIFCVMFYNATTDILSIQINNGPVDTASRSGGAFLSTAQFAIGAINIAATPINFMDGRIDMVGIWKRELNATERAELYNNGVGKQFPL